MNEYTYDTLSVGTQACFTAEVTAEKMAQFLSVTQDTNLLHNDDEFARSMNYDGRVAYGMLTSSFLSTLAGVYLPGKYALIQRVEVEFPRPVYVGDTLTVKGVVKEKNDAFRILQLKVTIHNQNGELVCRGKMRVGVLR